MSQEYDPIGLRITSQDNASTTLDNIISRLEKIQKLTQSINVKLGISDEKGGLSKITANIQQATLSSKEWNKYNELLKKDISSLTKEEDAFVKKMHSVVSAQKSIENSTNRLIISRNNLGISENNLSKAQLTNQELYKQGAGYEAIAKSVLDIENAQTRLNSAQFGEDTALNNKTKTQLSYARAVLNAQKAAEKLYDVEKKNASTSAYNTSAINSAITAKKAETSATKENTEAKKKNNDENDKNIKTLAASTIRLSTVYMVTRKLTEAFVNAINESGSYYENLNLFAVTFGETYKQSLDWALELANNLGFASSEVVRFTGLFKQLSTAIGITSDVSDKMSEVLTSLGYDLASFYNISTTSAFEKLQAGIFSGQTKPLRSLGLDVTYQTLDNVLKTNEAFAELGVTSSKGLDQATKAMLRLLVVLENSQNAWGDTTKTIESYENQVRVLQGSISNLKLAIGDVFRDSFANALVYINGFIQGITAIIRAFVPLEKEVDNVSAAMTQYADDTESATEATSGGLADFDEFRTLSSGSGEKQNLTIQEAITEELNKQIEAYQEYIESIDNISTKSQEIAEKIKSWFVVEDENGNNSLTKGAKALFAILAAIPIAAIASKFIKLSEAISKVAKAGGALTKSQKLFNLAFSKTGLIIGGVVAIFASMYITNEDFRNSINRLLSAIVTLIGSALEPLFNIIQDFSPVFTTLINTLAELLTPIINLIAKVVELGDGWVVLGTIIAIKGIPIIIKLASNIILLGKNISSLTPHLKVFKARIVSALGSIQYGGIAAAAGLALVISNTSDLIQNWDNMSGLERARGILLALAGALMVAATAAATFQASWSAGVLVAAIVAGVAAIGVSIASAVDQMNSLDSNIQGFAGGGITNANFIMTHENGIREWVGRQGSSTAVVNDTQMTDLMEQSVQVGAYKGILAALGAMSNNGTNTTNQNITIQIGSEEVFRVVRKEAKRQGLDFERVR